MQLKLRRFIPIPAVCPRPPEIKRRKRIDESIELEVGEKLRRLKLARNISRRTALVYEGSVAQAVQDNGFFDFLIPVSDLMR